MNIRGKTVECYVCKTPFYCVPSRLKSKVQTCSLKCRGEWSKVKPELSCSVCGKNFHLKKSQRDKRKLEPACSRDCRAKYLKKAYSGVSNPNAYPSHLDAFFAYKVGHIKSAAKQRKLAVTVTAEYLRSVYDAQNGLCCYSGIPMKLHSENEGNQPDLDTLSVDRIDSKKGYVPGNIALCCNAINKMKGSASVEETSTFVEKIALKNLGTCHFKVKRLHPCASIPSRAKPGDAGYDVSAVKVEDCGDYLKVWTGISIQPSPGWATFAFPRSSIYKKGLSLANSIGLVDNGYTGEIMAFFYKETAEWKPIEVGERIIQLVPFRMPFTSFEEVSELDSTERGTGGFGSSGVK